MVFDLAEEVEIKAINLGMDTDNIYIDKVWFEISVPLILIRLYTVSKKVTIKVNLIYFIRICIDCLYFNPTEIRAESFKANDIVS